MKTRAIALERVVGAHGPKGALINGHSRWPVVERVYAGNYASEVAGVLATAAWGWHIDTATHVLRLILSGALDRYEQLPASITDKERIAHGNAERLLRL